MASPSLTQLVPETLAIIVRLLPYKAVGRLVVTCKQTSEAISKEDIAKIRQHAKENFGKMESIDRPPYGSFLHQNAHTWIRIWDMDGEPLEMCRRVKNRDEGIYHATVHWKGHKFIGHCYNSHTIHLIEDLSYAKQKGKYAEGWYDASVDDEERVCMEITSFCDFNPEFKKMENRENAKRETFKVTLITQLD